MTAAPAAPSYTRSDWSSAFRNVGQELSDVVLEPTRGQVPDELAGVLYRNGPGRLERGGQWLHHPFDGDGMITALQLAGGQLQLSNRFVRTEGWLAEEAAGKVLYRGVFGSQKPGGMMANAFDLRLKNIANTGVVRLGDDLLALWEAAEPHALDPDSLETRGLSRLNGVLKPGEAFSAHPRFDPGHHGDPRMVTFGVKTGPRSTVRLMEFAADGSLLHDRRDSFNGFAFLHDFAITPNWAVFWQNAINFNPLPFVLGQKGAAQCLESNPKGQAKFWLIPRDSGAFAGQSAKVIDAPEGFVFHHLNAWEESDAVVLFMATSADSMSYAAAMVVSGQSQPPAVLRLFWALMIGSLTLVLLRIGTSLGDSTSINALQAFIVIAAVPVTPLVLTTLWTAPRLAWREWRRQQG